KRAKNREPQLIGSRRAAKGVPEGCRGPIRNHDRSHRSLGVALEVCRHRVRWSDDHVGGIKQRTKSHLTHRPPAVSWLVVEARGCALGSTGRTSADLTASLLKVYQRTGEVVIVQRHDGDRSVRSGERDDRGRQANQLI